MTARTAVDQLRLGDHICWIHDDGTDGLDAAGRFVAHGLGLGHKVVWCTDAIAPSAARAHLDERGVPTERALAGGQLRIVPAVESYLAGRRFSPERMIDSLVAEAARARREDYPGLRLVGDMGWALRQGASVAELCRYEAEVNQLFLTGEVAALCLYDRRLFAREQLHPVSAAHPATVGPHASGSWRPMLRAYRTSDPHGLRLVGEVDRSNREAFTAVLRHAGRPAPTGRTVLDVSELRFADVSAATVLARARRSGPTDVRLVGCRPALSRLLDLVGAVDPAGCPA
ncbi:MEDS domain-containing protein [Micromonospora sp. DT47]|uniref:MEDS domain-containing protein n=1 Tax=Micromonospora sp. DT47 TaxID=3393431 RepID=UPI003CEB30C4